MNILDSSTDQNSDSKHNDVRVDDKQKRDFIIAITRVYISLLSGAGLICIGLILTDNSLLQAVLVIAGSLIVFLASLLILIPAMHGAISGEAAPYSSTFSGITETAIKLSTATIAGTSGNSSKSRPTIYPDSEILTTQVKAAEPETAMSRALNYEKKALLRMSDNLRALGQRATWSLMTGVAFAGGGVIILFWSSVLSPPPSERGSDILAFLRQYGPRLSMSIIVELVAFFFLRTYARTLTDIRYVQNEFTNVEMKFIALHTSLEHSFKDITKKALDRLIETERNHILEKGQTSLEMERERVEASGFVNGLRAAADIVHGGKDKRQTATESK